MSGYFFLRICVEPTANPTSVLTEAANVIKKGLKGGAEVRYMFRVVGENVLCCVVKGPIDGAVKELNLSCGNFIRICCEPLRLYENYAKSILKVDETLATRLPKPFDLGGDMFLLEFNVEYKGKSMEELLGTWGREAVTAFTVRQQGMNLELFKVVGERRVYVLIKGDADTVDDITFSLPIMKENGDQVVIRTKAVAAFQ